MAAGERARVLICDGLADRGLELLRASGAVEIDYRPAIPAAELPAAAAPCQALIVRSASQVTAAVLAAAPGLKVIGRAGVGVDNIDVGEASRRGIVVVNTPRGNAVTTAEHALALLFALARRVPQADASLRAGRWERKKFAGVELAGKTLGVIGLGHIGRVVADRAQGLQMKVVAADPFISADAAAKLGVQLVPLDEVLARADVLSLHTPLTADTRHLLDARALARCRPGVLIVNAARGGLIDEGALVAALRSGQVGGAALDVYEQEPPPRGPLHELDNVVLTPHLGASTEEAQERVSVEVAELIVAFFRDGEVRSAVNLPSLPPDVHARLAPWLDLATRLGSLAGQLASGGIDEVEVEAAGEVAEQARPLATAALTGLLRTFLDTPVNRVNAPIIAADRGVRLTESRSAQGGDFRNALTLRVRGAGGERVFTGTLLSLGEEPEPRIVRVDRFLVEAVPEGDILVLRNEDRPGVIGAVGTLLGSHGINVARMQVGLDRPRGEAMQLWNVDGAVSEGVLHEIRRLPALRQATLVRL